MDVDLGLLADVGDDPELPRMRSSTVAGVHAIRRIALQYPGIRSKLRADLDLDREGPRSAVLVDGLAFHLRYDNEPLTLDDVMRMLAEQNAELLV